MIKKIALRIAACFTCTAISKRVVVNRKAIALYKKGITEYYNALSKLAE